MKRHFDFLCFSSTDWDEIWGSRQQIMSRLGQRGHRVIFIERPVGLEHLMRYPAMRENKFKRWKQGIRYVVENVWIFSLPPLLPGRYYSKTINAINQSITVKTIKRLLRKWNIHSPILWIYNPEQGNFHRKFNERLMIYHCIDEFTAGTSGRKKRVIAQLEEKLLEKADVVFANSRPTFENKLAINPDTFRITSGVDFNAFSSPKEFDEITKIFSGIPYPRIGYIGNINDRLDFNLLEKLVSQRSSWSFVFVGGTYPLSDNDPAIKRIESYSNCYLLGKKPYAQMPSFINEFDVCLLPFAQDEKAYFRSPLKLYEYFASGKPVVATSLPETLEYSRALYLADTPEQFMAGIENGLLENDPGLKNERQVIAQANTWDLKVDEIENILGSYLE